MRKQDLHLPAGPLQLREESGREHARFVENEEVPRPKVVSDLLKPVVDDFVVVTPSDEETTRTAGLGRFPCDSRGRKLEVVVGKPVRLSVQRRVSCCGPLPVEGRASKPRIS